VFASALGSDAVEVIKVGARTLYHSIAGVPDPQGLVYSPDSNKLFAASGSAGKVYIKVYIYDGAPASSSLRSILRAGPITSAL
jgi:hypothetical protein